MAGTDVHVKAGYWFVGYDNNRSIEEIPSELFTHLYAGFAVVNIQTGGVTFPPEYVNQFQAFPNTVRQRNPSVKALLSIGGPGSDISQVVRDPASIGGPGSDISQVVRDPAKRQTFIRDSISLAITYGYNGLDLCWLYPSSFDNGDDLIALLQEWRGAVSQEYAKKRNKDDHFLLTAAVFHYPAIPCPDGRSFNYPVNHDISVYLDLINVLAVDFYTPFNSSGETGPVHALHTRDTDPHHEPTRCGSRGIRDWTDNNNGVPAQKLVLGLPFHGHEWKLINPNVYHFFAPANPGDHDYKDYSTIQEIVNNDSTYQTWYDSDYVATYSHNKKGSWIGYDDETSITEKVTQAIQGNTKTGLLPLRGYVAWNFGGDDNNWPLTNAAYNAADAVNP